MRNFTRFLASRDVLKQKNLYNIRQAKALLEPTGRKAIARPAVKKESSVFPRDMSDSLPPYVSQDPMTPGLIDMERKKVAYLRKKDEVRQGQSGKLRGRRRLAKQIWKRFRIISRTRGMRIMA